MGADACHHSLSAVVRENRAVSRVVISFIPSLIRAEHTPELMGKWDTKMMIFTQPTQSPQVPLDGVDNDFGNVK